MSLKSADPCGGGIKEWLQGLSMVSMLTFFHALSSALILVVICLITYLGVARDLQTRNNDYINDETNVLLALLQEPNGKANLQKEIKREQSERAHVVHYVRILDRQDRTILENPQMELILPAGLFPVPTSTVPGFPRTIKRQAIDGNVYKLNSIRTRLDGFGADADVVQIAFDVTSMEGFLVKFRIKLAALLLLGVGLSAVAGYFTARRGLSPLARITDATKEITVSRLSERIHPGQWPREIATLVKHFNGMLDRLQESFDGLFNYTGNLAHELRTPINNLMIEGDIALLRERTPEEYQKVIGSSMEEYERLSRLIDSLLFLARADNSAHKIKLQTIDAGNEIERMSEFYSALATDHEVEISCHGTATLRADAVLFRRAVSNLVSNSVKYTPAGGKISVSVRQREDAILEVSVADTGCGIGPEQLPHIFDRFYRARPADEGEIQGYGLGLSIVKAIMTMHRGSIEVQSQLGQGTTVTLRFPPATAV